MLAHALPWIVMALEVLALVGLVVRGHVRAAVLLPVWLLAHIAIRLALALHPELNTWDFWNAKELATLALTLLLGLEIGARMSMHLPGLRRALTRDLVLLGLAVGALSRAELSGPVTTRLLPALGIVTALLFATLLAEAYLFYVPLARLHRVLLLGVPLTSMLYGVTWRRAADDTTVAAYANAVAFGLFMLVLCRAAWRREPVADVPRELVYLFWPWRA
jgi:hypothetical protein